MRMSKKVEVEVLHGYVDGRNYHEIPADGDTIADYIDIDMTLKSVASFDYSLRSGECWVVDFYSKQQPNFPCHYMKLPPDMTEEHFVRWIAPLVAAFKRKMQ
jgi:hypothetical protein